MFNIEKIKCYEVKIPFTRKFKHGSAEREVTETLLVQITDQDGNTGYGEGCPRSYVTGESITTATAFITRHQQEIKKLTSLDGIKTYLKDQQTEIDKNPAGDCK